MITAAHHNHIRASRRAYPTLPIRWFTRGWLSSTERASVSAISLRHILASPGYAPGTIAVNVKWMEIGFNAGQMHSSIYPSIFNRLRAIAKYWSEIATFPYPLHLTPPLGCTHWNSGKTFGPQKTRIMGLGATRQWRQFDDRLSCFDTIPACGGQTDGPTDVQPISITCTVILTHVKNVIQGYLSQNAKYLEKLRNLVKQLLL